MDQETVPQPLSHAQRHAEFTTGRKVQFLRKSGEVDESGTGDIVATWVDARDPRDLHLWVMVVFEKYPKHYPPCVLDPAGGFAGTTLRLVDPSGPAK